MCFFPMYNKIPYGDDRSKCLEFFECGHCPECLRKRSNRLALRDFFECKDHAYNCMVCLTYDTAVYDKTGRKIGEKLPPSDLRVNKRDVQLFIKRLRKHFSGQKIKYRASAEYGPHTGRPHYHVLLFGVRFSDYRVYKKSKRGNQIYTSPTLTKLWSHGIATIDNLSLNMASSFYASKYTAKDQRKTDTFMLCSQGIGLSSMITEFNGKSYWAANKEFPIPREVWQRILSARYDKLSHEFDYRYKNRCDCTRAEFERNRHQRARYRRLRDDDYQYQQYLAYWRKKGENFDIVKQSWNQRLAALPNDKYWKYKLRASEMHNKIIRDPFARVQLTDPRASSAPFREVLQYIDRFPRDQIMYRKYQEMCTCPDSSRLYRASDTKTFIPAVKKPEFKVFDGDFVPVFFDFRRKSGVQLSFFEKNS